MSSGTAARERDKELSLVQHLGELRDRLDAMHAQGLQMAIKRRAIEPPGAGPQTSRTNRRQQS